MMSTSFSTDEDDISILHKCDYNACCIGKVSCISVISILHKCDYNVFYVSVSAVSGMISILHKCDYNGETISQSDFDAEFQFYISAITILVFTNFCKFYSISILHKCDYNDNNH